MIWNGAPSPDALALEAALRRFAAAARLTFVEIALAPVRARPRRRARRSASATRTLRRARPRAHSRRARRRADADARRRAPTRRWCCHDSDLRRPCRRRHRARLRAARRHCGYPYRLLDLARFPDEYRVTVRWTDGGPGGIDRHRRLASRSRRDQRRLRSLPRARRSSAAAWRRSGRCDGAADRGRSQPDGARRGSRLSRGQSCQRRALEQLEAVSGARDQPHRAPRADDARHERSGRRARLRRRARRRDLQVGERRAIDRAPRRRRADSRVSICSATARRSFRRSCRAATSACTRSARHSSRPRSSPTRSTIATRISTARPRGSSPSICRRRSTRRACGSRATFDLLFAGIDLKETPVGRVLSASRSIPVPAFSTTNDTPDSRSARRSRNCSTARRR